MTITDTKPKFRKMSDIELKFIEVDKQLKEFRTELREVKEELKSYKKNTTRFKKPKEIDIANYFFHIYGASEKLAGEMAKGMYNHFEESGWQRGRTKIKSWERTADKWWSSIYSNGLKEKHNHLSSSQNKEAF